MAPPREQIMRLNSAEIEKANQVHSAAHRRDVEVLSEQLARRGLDPEKLIAKIGAFQVAVPSWALGTGGTRFGRFPIGGEPGSLDQKIEDAGLLRALSRQTASISLHIPWDIPRDAKATRELAAGLGLKFDAVNSNTFQDAKNHSNMPRGLSYKFGSLCHSDAQVRRQAVEHNLEVVRYGVELGSEAITVWLADGTNYPGQANFRRQFERVRDSLKEIYKALPPHWAMFTEHKPYEPNFYSSVVSDWGSSLLLARATGERCRCLVDLGHHLPNTNIEQIVSRLLMEGRLAGFHFNDSKYSDDDLTTGCIKSYQLFLIFVELVEFLEGGSIKNPPLAWMIDASHNTKDPLEDLVQSLEAIALAYGQALLLPRRELEEAQDHNDPAWAQEILQNAYRTDVRPLLAEARLRQGGAIYPVEAYRRLGVRERLVKERGSGTVATGL